MDTQDTMNDKVELAIARRLSRLGMMPVDTSRLDRAIQSQIPRTAAAHWRFIRPLVAIAASIVILSVLAVLLIPQGTVQASPDMMMQMHQDIVSGKIPTMKVGSVDEANQAITAMAGNSLRLPEPPVEHVMACCMTSIKNKKVACMLLANGGTPITMTVADAKDVTCPKTPTVLHNGNTYHVTQSSGLTMVVAQSGHNWICIMGKIPADRLMDIADKLHY